MLASLTMVPMFMRWRRASRASGTRHTPSVVRHRPGGSPDRRSARARPGVTKSRHQCQLSRRQVAHKRQCSRTSSYSSSGRKPPPSATRHQVLHQHIQRLARGELRASIRPLRDGVARGGAFDHLEAVGRHQRHPRRPPRRMAGAPGRCSSRATPLAEPICRTRSTGRKSTPRSRLEVQTTAFSSTVLERRSTHSRVSARSSEP